MSSTRLLTSAALIGGEEHLVVAVHLLVVAVDTRGGATYVQHGTERVERQNGEHEHEQAHARSIQHTARHLVRHDLIWMRRVEKAFERKYELFLSENTISFIRNSLREKTCRTIFTTTRI